MCRRLLVKTRIFGHQAAATQMGTTLNLSISTYWTHLNIRKRRIHSVQKLHLLVTKHTTLVHTQQLI